MMATTDGLNLQFLRQHLERGVQRIFEAQRNIASAKIYSRPTEGSRSRSGALLDALSAPRYTLAQSGKGGIKTDSSVPTYIRFLDMEKHGNYQIYNRQIWGILYGDTLLGMRAEYRDWLTGKMNEMLAAANPGTA